ncbi:MAG: hypothetical protein KZQ63_06525 [Candidatus Thiodiazotropha sp. (ex Lucinoma aequizonata)]|nr:hypothetical protein [Candidatus Thiodiazotropha sp. (ex Lucinoma aequizonata)]MCU7911753.1 hypothetical protein [Candidatus Thiodiazotropha sp. (ex Lucinoma aequizonata)]
MVKRASYGGGGVIEGVKLQIGRYEYHQGVICGTDTPLTAKQYGVDAICFYIGEMKISGVSQGWEW